jgi:hypothetical protein
VAGRIVSMKNSDGVIGNRTGDVPAFKAVHQPTAPPRPFLFTCSVFIKAVLSLDTSRNCHVIVQNVMEQILHEVARSEFE